MVGVRFTMAKCKNSHRTEAAGLYPQCRAPTLLARRLIRFGRCEGESRRGLRQTGWPWHLEKMGLQTTLYNTTSIANMSDWSCILKMACKQHCVMRIDCKYIGRSCILKMGLLFHTINTMQYTSIASISDGLAS